MKPIQIKPKIRFKYRVDMSFLSDIYKYDSLTTFRAKKVMYGNQEYRLDNIFDISNGDKKNLVVKSANSLMDNLGYRLKEISLKVFGDVGDYLGAQMSSGLIEIYGNANDHCASGLKGGIIRVNGNCGDYLGSKPNSSNEGISDGLIYISGNVGNKSLQRIRRGNIIIEGNLGDDACSEMISGSVLIKGKIGRNFANGIKRGTIFTTQKKLAKNYSKSNAAEFNFIKFFINRVSNVINRNLFINNRKFIRYYGNKDKKNISELFLFD